VSKQQVRVLFQKLREEGPGGKGLIRHKTSGTSGEFVEVVRSWHEERFLTVIRTLAFRSFGFRAGFKQARIRVPADFDWLNDAPLQILNGLGLFRSRIFSCFDEPDFVWKQLSAYQPDVIMGYSEAVARVARYGLESGLSDLNPKIALLGGELCTPLMLRQISEAFRAPVYQGYASTEVNLIAWSCPNTSLFHICDPAVLVEVLDDSDMPVAPGESGRAIVTALHSRTMPFIRFEVGDRVIKGPTPCACGAPYSTLQSIDGREMDRLHLANGKSLHGFVLLNEMIQHDTSWMRQYQLVQDEPEVIELHVAPLNHPDPDVLEFLTIELQKLAGDTVFRIKLVKEMTLDENGKFHLCKCNLK
jgi:phenylacetate-CoA ligase